MICKQQFLIFTFIFLALNLVNTSNATLNSSLLNYWSMESNLADIGGINFSTSTNYVNVPEGCIYGKCYNQTNVINKTTSIVPTLFNDRNVSFNYWFYMKEKDQPICYHFWIDNRTTYSNMNLGGIYAVVSYDIAIITTINYSEVNNTWAMFSWVRNQTHLNIYLNGRLINSTVLNTVSTSGGNLYLGASLNPQLNCEGYTDEISYFNKSLNLSELQQLYHNFDILVPVVTPTPTDAIYDVLESSGGGLSRFIQIISLPLFYFLLVIGLIVGTIYIFHILTILIKQSFKPDGLQN